MSREGKRFTRWFLIACWLIAVVAVLFPPIAALAIPAGAAWLIIRAARRRRPAASPPRLPEYALQDIPIELRERYR